MGRDRDEGGLRMLVGGFETDQYGLFAVLGVAFFTASSLLFLGVRAGSRKRPGDEPAFLSSEPTQAELDRRLPGKH